MRCGGMIEFDAASAGQEATCPHCGKSTWVDLPEAIARRLAKPKNLIHADWILKGGLGAGALLLLCLLLKLGITNRELQVSNVELQTANARLKHEVQMTKESSEELTKNVQAAIDSQEIAGLYEWKPPYSSHYQELDLRSDGTGQFDNGQGSRSSSANWLKNLNGSITIGRQGTFKVENGDLIDQRGNRWIHIR